METHYWPIFVFRGFTVRVEERRYGPPAEASTPFHKWPRDRPRFETECALNEEMVVTEAERYKTNHN